MCKTSTKSGIKTCSPVTERKQNRKQKSKQNLKRETLLAGSMTVEAALLLPLLLGVMVFTIFAAVFLYNKCAVQAMADQAAVMAAGMEHESPAQIQKSLERYLEEEKTHLPLAEKAESKVSVSLLKVTTEVSVSQKVSAMLIPLTSQSAEFQAKATVHRLDPAKYIRTIKIAPPMASGSCRKATQTSCQ